MEGISTPWPFIMLNHRQHQLGRNNMKSLYFSILGYLYQVTSVLPVTCALRAFSIQHVLWFLTRWLRSVGGPGLNSLTPYSTSLPCVLEYNSTNARPSRAPWSPIEIIDEHRQTGRQAGRQADRQTGRQTAVIPRRRAEYHGCFIAPGSRA